MSRGPSFMLFMAANVLIVSTSLTAADATKAKTNMKATRTAVNKATALRMAWPAETLSGKITLVDPTHNAVVIRSPDGVSYDLDVTAKTQIKSGDHAIRFQDLKHDVSKSVTVKIVPERRGDIAEVMWISS